MIVLSYKSFLRDAPHFEQEGEAFRRQRLWCAPAAHPLLLKALQVRGAPTTLQCQLSQPWLSYLHDHQVNFQKSNAFAHSCISPVITKILA